MLVLNFPAKALTYKVWTALILVTNIQTEDAKEGLKGLVTTISYHWDHGKHLSHYACRI